LGKTRGHTAQLFAIHTPLDRQRTRLNKTENNACETGRKDCSGYRRLARYWCRKSQNVWPPTERGDHYAKGTDAAASVVKEIEHSGRKAIAIQADAADAKAVKAAVDKTVATFGRLDVLVNNAGTAIPKTFEETTLEEMDRVININIRGVFAAIRGRESRGECTPG
jgi:NAD(P)-dependent dehydrogenase (short-subunit alcohol dehydrogenase family)